VSVAPAVPQRQNGRVSELLLSTAGKRPVDHGGVPARSRPLIRTVERSILRSRMTIWRIGAPAGCRRALVPDVPHEVQPAPHNRLLLGKFGPVVGLLLTVCSCAPFRSSLSEANIVAKQYWDGIVVRCGDRYVSYGSITEYQEVRGFAWAVEKYDLTDADKLNGYEWKGATVPFASAFRMGGRPGRGDGDWTNWINGSGLSRVTLVKKNGRWIFNEGIPKVRSRYPSDLPIDCTKIPR